MIKVGVVDQNNLFREALVYSLNDKTGLNVEMSFETLIECKEKLYPGSLNVLIYEIGSFKDADDKLIRQMVHHFPEVKFIILSDELNKNLVLDFVRIGIINFFPKSISVNELKEGIEKAILDQNPLQLFFDQGIQNSLEKNGTIEFNELTSGEFSDRELEILRMVCKEYTNSEIAEELGLSARTIETHRRRMIEKTNSKTMIGVILFALNISKEDHSKNNIRLRM
ncbi:MAG: response regulator transcription factor [Crocinitomicaceae bacterium]